MDVFSDLREWSLAEVMQMPRTTGFKLLGAALLLAGCSSGSSDNSGTGGVAAGGAGTGGGSSGSSTGGSADVGGGSVGSGGSTNGPGGGGAGGGPSAGVGGAQGTDAGSTSGAGGAGGTTASGDAATGADGAAGPALPLVVTSAQNAYWRMGMLTTSTANATLTVDANTTFQTIEGFGGAFNEVGWRYLSMLSAADRTTALKLLFDRTDGANFLYGRIPIGASDYATTRYTDDESPGDFSMAQFSINQDQMFLIPYVKAALATNPSIHLWGSAWTPPTWMKNGPFTTSSAFDGGNMKGDAQTLEAFALYLTKWVQAYAQQGLTIEMVVPQNEPNYAQGYPSCIWSPTVFDTFVANHLGPMLAMQNVSTKIFLGTMSKTSSPGDTDVMAAVLGDANAMKYIGGFGMQWTMQNNGALNFSGNASVASAVSSSHLTIWQTEHQAGNYPWAGGFVSSRAPNDHAYGIESWGLIRNWLRAGANSYSAWNMVLDTGGLGNDTIRVWPQDSLLVVDTNARTVNATPAYYVFRHFSQYIQPGATRIATTGSLDSLAFKNPDGSIVTVIYNSGTSAAQTILSVGGAKLQFTVPASGFATVVK
jgi:glucosylceramidase